MNADLNYVKLYLANSNHGNVCWWLLRNGKYNLNQG